MQMKLSETLRTMRDQFRGYEVAEGQVIISGEALSSLVETLDFAARAAATLEHQLEHGATPTVHARPAGRVVPLPRRRPHHSRAQRHATWRPGPATHPGGDMSDHDDDGGDAA